VGAAMRAFDWSSSSLGPPECWSHSLKTLVSVLLSSSQPMFLAWGPDRTWLYNEAFTPILSRKHPVALGRPAMEVWAEARGDLEPLFDRVFAGEAVHMEDFSLLLDRGGELERAHFAFSYTPVRDEDETVAGLFGACIETTKQVFAGRELMAQREQFAQLFEQAPTFMAVLRGPGHRFELANPGYRQLVGHRPILGKTVAEALPDAVAQGYLDLLDQVFASGKAYVAQGAKYIVQPTPDESPTERFVDFVYQPILGADGHVNGIFVEGFDVTERKRAEAALQEMNATLERRIGEAAAALQAKETLIQTFFDCSSECYAVLVETEGGRFRYEEINPSTLRLYNKTREQAVGLTTEEVVGPERAAELNRHMAACLRSGAPYRYERTQGDGIVEALATPVPEEPGKARRVVVSARDATERRRLEAQLRQAQKMEAVGQLTGGIAHDFNNLLAGISGSLELLQKRLSAGRYDATERYVAAAQGSAKRAATLTQRLLAFSRLQMLDPKPTDLNRLIGGMEDLIRRSTGPAIEVEFVGAGGLWLTHIDPSQLENALLNLCINGRDAMAGKGGGRLTIETANKWLDERAARERDLPPGQYLSLCVTDTGSGMTPEVKARAFDPFYTTKPLGQGTGLGLSMVHGFARQSGGQVQIYSEIGIGTTVCLYLPRHAGKTAPAEEKEYSRTEPGSGETVLIIDDESTVRMLIVEVLEENGYTAIEAVDGAGGLKILQSGARIDLLITDVGLPGGMNGRQVVDAARAERPDLKVLFITGYAENAAIGNGHLDAGMEILTKPFTMETLANKIHSLIVDGERSS
jgi:PAS domain S-box-containing protein